MVSKNLFYKPRPRRSRYLWLMIGFPMIVLLGKMLAADFWHPAEDAGPEQWPTPTTFVAHAHLAAPVPEAPAVTASAFETPPASTPAPHQALPSAANPSPSAEQPAAPAVVQPAPAALAPTEPQAAIKKTIDTWSQAWSGQDTATYLAQYAPGYFPKEFKNRASWEKTRIERIRQKKKITHEISNLSITVSTDKAVASFDQTYIADHIRSITKKNLHLSLAPNNRWLITGETNP